MGSSTSPAITHGTPVRSLNTYSRFQTTFKFWAKSHGLKLRQLVWYYNMSITETISLVFIVYKAYNMSQTVHDCSLPDAVNNEVAEDEHRKAFKEKLSVYDEAHLTIELYAPAAAELGFSVNPK